MSRSTSLTPLSQSDYEAIEDAVMETARGRWFLAEYASRNRNADTTMLMGAIEKLERALTGERAIQEIERIRFELAQMARAIASAKSEVAAIRPSADNPNRLEEASEALDGIVRTTEHATSDILEAAEAMQEAAWTLREQGADEGLCNVLDAKATDIYTACEFQDITAQRTQKIVSVLRFLEGRINAMIDMWGDPRGAGATPTPSPAETPSPLNEITLSQSDVDVITVQDDEVFLLSEDGIEKVESPLSPVLEHEDIAFEGDEAVDEPTQEFEAEVVSMHSACSSETDEDPFKDLDSLTSLNARDKLRLFT